MAFRIIDQVLGSQPIADTSTTQKHPLGTIVRAVDPTYGGGEFIYLKGVVSTTVGSFVNYDNSFQTALETAVTAGPPRPLAVSMSANVASQYGWYQISGMANGVKADTLSLADNLAFGVTAGLVVAAVTGSLIHGAILAAVSSAKSGVTSILVAINRPHTPSDIS